MSRFALIATAAVGAAVLTWSLLGSGESQRATAAREDRATVALRLSVANKKAVTTLRQRVNRERRAADARLDVLEKTTATVGTGPASPGPPAELVTGASEFSAGSGYRSAIATCPAGKLVTGGGAAVEGVAGPQLNITRPAADRASWGATGYASANFGAWQVTAYAICAA